MWYVCHLQLETATVPARGIEFQAMVGIAEDARGEGGGGSVLEHGGVRWRRGRLRFLVVGDAAPDHCGDRAAAHKSSRAERAQRPQDLR